MAEGTSDKTWIDVQKKTFTRWSNNFLSERILKIDDLSTDLHDGVLLINLLEIISAKQLPKYNKKAKMLPQKLENNGIALRFIKSEGLKLVNMGPEDIVDGNLKLILGLIWTLILRYQIQKGGDEGSPKWELLEWVRRQVAPYGLKPDNFTTDWQDGKVLTALTDSLKPGVLPYDQRSGNALHDTQTAMDTAEKEYEIPKILDAADLVNTPDELSTMTYVSYFRDWDSEDNKRRRAAAEAERLRRLKTADPSQCYAFGPGLEAGATNNSCPFTIQAVNYFGDKLPTGGDDFQVTITGPDSPKCYIKDNANGTYDCSYVPKAPGEYTVDIKLRGEPIKNSPYGPVHITGPDHHNTVASGPGVEGGRAGPAVPFRIESRDKNNNPVKTGNDPFKVTVKGPNGQNVPVNLHDNLNGTYDGSYPATQPGQYEVAVTLNGEHIKDSPFHPLLEAANANQSWAEGPGLHEGKTGKPCPFTIHAKDADGVDRNTGGDPFKVDIKGPQAVTPKVRDNNDGTYSVEYVVDQPGDYTVNVTLHGQPIKDAPFHPHIKPSADPSKCWADGPGLKDPKDNEPAVFTIHAVDKNGNPRTDGGDPFDVKITGTENLKPEVVDNNDGTYTVTYHPDKPGAYRIDVTLDGQNIKDAPFRVDVKQGIDYDHTSFATFSFTVQTKDKHGAIRRLAGDKFDVQISGPAQVKAQTRDNGDGSYTANYALETPGNYTLNVTLNGRAIKGSPFHQSF